MVNGIQSSIRADKEWFGKTCQLFLNNVPYKKYTYIFNGKTHIHKKCFKWFPMLHGGRESILKKKRTGLKQCRAHTRKIWTDGRTQNTEAELTKMLKKCFEYYKRAHFQIFLKFVHMWSLVLSFCFERFPQFVHRSWKSSIVDFHIGKDPYWVSVGYK